MSVPLGLAAVIIVIVGAAHSYLGERYILIRLFRRNDLPKLFGSDLFTQRTLRMAWHVTTVVWWGVGALLFALAGSYPAPLSVSRIGFVLAATCLASAFLSFLMVRGRHLSWVAFLLLAMLVWRGTT